MNADALWTLAGKIVTALGLTEPVFYVAVGLILLLEWRFSAVPSQPLVGRSFCFDALWSVVRLAGNVAVLGPFVALMNAVYENHLAFLTVPGIASLPTPARLTLGILTADLLAWFHHFVRHKIAWSFHAVHHSQPEMNLFTDDRNHVIDLVVAAAVRVFPMLMLSVEVPQVLAWTLFSTWFTRLYHANLRTDFGPLRHVLVTPQSHRIHHSTDPRHHEKNFGLIFSFWDRLFGTQYQGWDEYPETGVKDPTFPLEHGGPFEMARALVAQQIHPFTALWTARRSGER